MANRNTNQRAEQKAFDIAPYQGQVVAAEPEFRKLALAAARNVDFNRESNFALSKVKESDGLQRCHPESFREALENLGSMGLTLNPNLGQAALIPRWNAKRRCNWVVAQPMYRGFIALATSGTKIKNVWGAVVLDGDDFKMIRGSHPRIEHITPMRKKGEGGRPSFANILGAYVCAEIEGSQHPHITWMSIDDILAIAERSDSFNPKPRAVYENGQKTNKMHTPEPSGPWVTDPGEMSIKTVFRRGFKTWPIDTTSKEYHALAEAVRVDQAAEVMEYSREEEAAGKTDEGGTLVITKYQAVELEALALKKKCRPAVVCKAYGVESFAALPADKYEEVKTRIAAFGSKN